MPLPVGALQPAPAAEADRPRPAELRRVLWLGRLSLLTKLDPWPTYQMLERVSQRLEQPLFLVECGPDDHPSQSEPLNTHRQLCPSVHFLRLGGEQPVSEEIKHQALAAADIAVSLVDNPQETLGLAVAEAMAAGSLLWFRIGTDTEIWSVTEWMASGFQQGGRLWQNKLPSL